jgi:hypothetical protein
MKRTFCDGCDNEIVVKDGTASGDARLNLCIKAVVPDAQGVLGQFEQNHLDLCSWCVERMKTAIDPRQWERPAQAAPRRYPS